MASRKALETAHTLVGLSPEEAAELIDQHYPPPPADEMKVGFQGRIVRYEFGLHKLELMKIVDYGKGNGVEITVIDFADKATVIRVLKSVLGLFQK